MQEDSVFSKASTTSKVAQKGIFDELKLSNIFLKEVTDLKEVLGETQDRAERLECENHVITLNFSLLN